LTRFSLTFQANLARQKLTKKDSRKSRAVTTGSSRSVSMISPDYNLNPVFDVRRRW
jgi:hypothetical protein